MATAANKAAGEDIAPVREEFKAETFSPVIEAPKRRGRPPGSKNKTTTTRTSANLETQIGALLVTVNMPLTLIPALQKDALDQVEIMALAKGIKSQCDASPTFKKYVEQALKITGATSLLAVVAIIASRRAVRHGVVPIPEEMGGPAIVDALLGGALSTMTGQGTINPNLMVMNSAEPAA